jgi:hypothetical protein
MDDDELSRKRALRDARNDPEFEGYPDSVAATMYEIREDWKRHMKEAAAAWEELFVDIAAPSGMEVVRDSDGTTAYSDHPVEIQRLCRTSAPRVVGDVEISMVVAQGHDGSLCDAKVSIASQLRNWRLYCRSFWLTWGKFEARGAPLS